MARYGNAIPKRYGIPGICDPSQAIRIKAMTARNEKAYFISYLASIKLSFGNHVAEFILATLKPVKYR